MLEQITQSIPDVAKDIRLNLVKVLDFSQTDGLTQEQILGSALAISYSLVDKEMISVLENLIGDQLLINAAKLAASLMAMTNVYYRFVHLSENQELEHTPAGLRMQGMMNPGVERVTFEVLCLAVSALNGCGACISSHASQLQEQGFSSTSLARIGRISAVIHASHVSRQIA